MCQYPLKILNLHPVLIKELQNTRNLFKKLQLGKLKKGLTFSFSGEKKAFNKLTSAGLPFRSHSYTDTGELGFRRVPSVGATRTDVGLWGGDRPGVLPWAILGSKFLVPREAPPGISGFSQALVPCKQNKPALL